MSELDEFVKWVGSDEAKRSGKIDIGWFQLSATVDIFRNWKRMGRVKGWVDAYQENKDATRR